MIEKAVRKASDRNVELSMSMEDKLNESIFFVEATSFEQSSLWSKNKRRLDEGSDYGYKWRQDSSGFYTGVGYIDDNPDIPVTVSLSFAVLNGYRVCFYNPTSRYVDWDLVGTFIKNFVKGKEYDNGRMPKCDAQNFHHCTGYIHDLSKGE